MGAEYFVQKRFVVPAVLEVESSRRGGLNCLTSGKDPVAMAQPRGWNRGRGAGKRARSYGDGEN